MCTYTNIYEHTYMNVVYMSIFNSYHSLSSGCHSESPYIYPQIRVPIHNYIRSYSHTKYTCISCMHLILTIVSLMTVIYIYMYIYIHIYIYIYIYINIYIYIHIYEYVYHSLSSGCRSESP
jgi:hypothetical protein